MALSTILGTLLGTLHVVIHVVTVRGRLRVATDGRGERVRVHVLPFVAVIAGFVFVFPDVVAGSEPRAGGHRPSRDVCVWRARRGCMGLWRMRRPGRGFRAGVRGHDARVPLDVPGLAKRRRAFELAADTVVVHAREPSGVAERRRDRRARIVYGRVDIHGDVRGFTCVV